MLFLVGTAFATLTTGEHYVIDLVPGLAFGCFAYAAGNSRMRRAFFYLAIVVCWALVIRFSGQVLVAYPALTKVAAALTLAVAVHSVVEQWRAGFTVALPEPVQVQTHAATEAPVTV